MPNKTNKEFIDDFIDFCPTGALGQLFILDAVSKFAKVAAEKRIPDNGFITPEAWQATAKAWLTAYEQNYGK